MRGGAHYRRARLYFSSGTGNSYRVTRWLAELAGSAGVEVEVEEVEGADPRGFRPGPEALLGLLFPTHGFTAPWNDLRFALSLPRGRGTHAFVLATRAGTKAGPLFLPGMEGTAAWLVALVLLLRGYRVRGVAAVDMPSNWLALHPGFSRPAAEAIVARARPRVEAFGSALLSGGRRYRGFLPLALGLLLAQVSLLYLLLGRFLLAKLFFADSRCTSCALCADSCPNRAIRMIPLGRSLPRPYWGFACASCMRCMGFCPQRAVQAGHSWMLLLVLLTSLPVGATLALALLPGAEGAAWLADGRVAFLVQYPFTLALAAAGYLLFWAATSRRPLNALFTFTTFTRLFRRYHEPGTTLAELAGRGK